MFDRGSLNIHGLVTWAIAGVSPTLLIGSTTPPPPPRHPPRPRGQGVSSHRRACVYRIVSTISFHRKFFLIKYSKASRPYFFFY